jgi:hypothetical protein
VGDDVGGIAVHIGARMAAIGGAGEVLVSCAVKDLVAASGLRFGDRGGHSLKLVNGRCAALTIWGDAHRLSYLRQMSLVGQKRPKLPWLPA